jgi:hypothetical protein
MIRLTLKNFSESLETLRETDSSNLLQLNAFTKVKHHKDFYYENDNIKLFIHKDFKPLKTRTSFIDKMQELINLKFTESEELQMASLVSPYFWNDATRSDLD